MPLIHLTFLCIFRQESQLKTALLGILNSIQALITAHDETLSNDLASYQTWSDSNGHNASLEEITGELKSLKAEVSDSIFYSLEAGEFDAVALSEFVNRITGGSKLFPRNYSTYE